MSILVVEDEPFIAMYVEDCLVDAGFRVLTAPNADKAVTLLERDPSIRIVITDIDMPGSMDGLELANVVRNRWPPVTLIVASGKYRPEVEQMPKGALFLPKPYLGADLLSTLARLN